jgi:biotin transport system substrate-specific component
MKQQEMRISVRDMVYVALFAAVLSAVAPFSIAIGPIPLSFATLIIYIAAGALGWKHGTLAVLIYVALGAIGVPVFSNFEGGFHKIAGVTGGFIIGYIPCALITGLAVDSFGKKLWTYAAGMVIGTVLLYTCGTAWFMAQTGSPLAVALALCVTPFLIGDTIKIVVACIAAPQLRNAIERVARM